MDTPLVPHGPRRILPKNQVTLSEDLLEAIGVRQGDKVFVMVNPDRPGSLVVISEPLMAEIFRKGWAAV